MTMTTDIDQIELFSKLKNKALRLLAKRDYSGQELKTKLKMTLRGKDNSVQAMGQVIDQTLDQVIDRMQELGYLAVEGDLASRWVDQWRKKGKGRLWIGAALKAKGLPSLALKDDETELQVLKDWIKKKLGDAKPKDLPHEERTRLARSLVSRGFSTSLVATVLK